MINILPTNLLDELLVINKKFRKFNSKFQLKGDLLSGIKYSWITQQSSCSVEKVWRSNPRIVFNNYFKISIDKCLKPDKINKEEYSFEGTDNVLF